MPENSFIVFTDLSTHFQPSLFVAMAFSLITYLSGKYNIWAFLDSLAQSYVRILG